MGASVKVGNKCNEKNMKQIGKVLNFAGICRLSLLVKFDEVLLAMKMRLRTMTKNFSVTENFRVRKDGENVFVKLGDKFDN